MILTLVSFQPIGAHCIAEDDNGNRYYFHHTLFETFQGEPIPPIPGEQIEVEVGSTSKSGTPRILKAVRLRVPVARTLPVVYYNYDRDYGILREKPEEEFLLFRNMIRGHDLPSVGDHVKFVVGSHKGKPIACYAEILP